MIDRILKTPLVSMLKELNPVSLCYSVVVLKNSDEVSNPICLCRTLFRLKGHSSKLIIQSIFCLINLSQPYFPPLVLQTHELF